MTNYGFWKALKDIKAEGEAAKDAMFESFDDIGQAREDKRYYDEQYASSKQQEIAELERLIAEKEANALEYTLSANARYYEAQKRGELGMDAATLAIIGDTQQQLQQEEIDLLKENLDTEQQDGVADLKFPWKITIGLLAIAGGVWYWRK